MWFWRSWWTSPQQIHRLLLCPRVTRACLVWSSSTYCCSEPSLSHESSTKVRHGGSELDSNIYVRWEPLCSLLPNVFLLRESCCCSSHALFCILVLHGHLLPLSLSCINRIQVIVIEPCCFLEAPGVVIRDRNQMRHSGGYWWFQGFSLNVEDKMIRTLFSNTTDLLLLQRLSSLLVTQTLRLPHMVSYGAIKSL